MTVKWIAVAPGLPGDIRTEDVAYVTDTGAGEVEFLTEPTNSDLNTAFPGRIDAINDAIGAINDSLITIASGVPLFRLMDFATAFQEQVNGMTWLQDWATQNGVQTLQNSRANYQSLLA